MKQTLKEILFLIDLCMNVNNNNLNGVLRETTSTGLPSELTHLTLLQELLIGGNNFDSIPSIVYELATLNALVENSSQPTISLNYCDMSNNLITSFPTELLSLSSLTSLAIAANNIVELPEVLTLLTSIANLDISGNSLTGLPTEIGNMLSLSELDLTGNFLTTLPKEIETLALSDLALDGNYLDCEDVDILAECSTQNSLNFKIHHCPAITISTACEDACDGTNPVCVEDEGECVLNCGTEHYYKGDFCYYCQDYLSNCEKCDAYGFCEVCSDGTLYSENQCVTLQQNAVNKIGEQLVNDGWTNCTAPVLENCTNCTGIDCGTFNVILNDNADVVEVELSSNQMTSIPSEIGQLSSLTNLDVSGNSLHTIPSEIGELTTLQSLLVINV